MGTRRVSGPFVLICRGCGAKYGPFTQASGSFKCNRCGRINTVG
jgi:ribosomal protein S27E